MTKQRYPNKAIIINRILGYLNRIEKEKLERKDLDTAYILRNIIKTVKISTK